MSVEAFFCINFKQWNRFEKIWLFAFFSVIVATTAYFSWTGTDYSNTQSILLNWIISPVSAISGILCVVLAAKGKISNWTYGILNSLLYGFLAYHSGYYGDAIINIFYFLPTQFVGILFWKTRLANLSKTTVRMRRFTVRQGIGLGMAAFSICVGFGICLHMVDSWFTDVMKRNVSIYTYFESVLGDSATFAGPMLDSATEITQILAQIFMVFAYAEQWAFWTATNIITILMWAVVIVADPSSTPWALPTLIMWCAYLVNSVYGWIVWNRGARNAGN